MGLSLNTGSKRVVSDISWKSDAFLNVYYTNPESGVKSKIGAISFKESKPKEAAIIARCQEDGALEILLKGLSLDFQVVDNDKIVAAGF